MQISVNNEVIREALKANQGTCRRASLYGLKHQPPLSKASLHFKRINAGDIESLFFTNLSLETQLQAEFFPLQRYVQAVAGSRGKRNVHKRARSGLYEVYPRVALHSAANRLALPLPGRQKPSERSPSSSSLSIGAQWYRKCTVISNKSFPLCASNAVTPIRFLYPPTRRFSRSWYFQKRRGPSSFYQSFGKK